MLFNRTGLVKTYYENPVKLPAESLLRAGRWWCLVVFAVVPGDSSPRRSSDGAVLRGC